MCMCVVHDVHMHVCVHVHVFTTKSIINPPHEELPRIIRSTLEGPLDPLVDGHLTSPRSPHRSPNSDGFV